MKKGKFSKATQLHENQSTTNVLRNAKNVTIAEARYGTDLDRKRPGWRAALGVAACVAARGAERKKEEH